MGERHRLGFRFTRAARATAATLMLATGAFVGPSAAAAPTPTYYVAMGDSLGAGIGASPASNSYVNLIYAHELARIPGLALRNFSCSGATTSSVIHGGNCGSPTTQLATAEAFLKAHPGQIAFLTIDIGANDVAGCNGAPDNTCLANALAAVNSNLPLILSGLKAAYPGIRVFGMNYYDPFLSSWLTGPAGETAARQSATQADAFNTILADKYAAAGFPTADVATTFQNDDFSLTGTYNNQVEPQNVANICNWTHMCEANDIHANNTGHAALAQSFEPLIDAPARPSAPVSATAAAANASATVHWIVPATETSTLTGYVVTPYVGAVAQPARTFATTATTATTATISGLTNTTRYTFKVAAKNAIGTGPQSAATAPVTVGAPAPPTAVKAVSGSTTTATGTLSITFVAGANNGAPITSYTATCTSTNGGALRSGVRNSATAGAIAVGGVTTAKTYSCRVAAANSRGTSAASVGSAPVTVGAPPKPVVHSTLSGSLTVSFVRPANNGAAITGFTATCTSANGGVTKSRGGSVGPLTVTGLSPTKIYTCTVRATNNRGTGAASIPSAPVTA